MTKMVMAVFEKNGGNHDKTELLERRHNFYSWQLWILDKQDINVENIRSSSEKSGGIIWSEA